MSKDIGVEKLREWEQRLSDKVPGYTKEKVDRLRESIYGRNDGDEYSGGVKGFGVDKKTGINNKQAICKICSGLKTGFRVSKEHKQDMCLGCYDVLHEKPDIKQDFKK